MQENRAWITWYIRLTLKWRWLNLISIFLDILRFDNSYSWTRNKKILYNVEITTEALDSLKFWFFVKHTSNHRCKFWIITLYSIDFCGGYVFFKGVGVRDERCWWYVNAWTWLSCYLIFHVAWWFSRNYHPRCVTTFTQWSAPLHDDLNSLLGSQRGLVFSIGRLKQTVCLG